MKLRNAILGGLALVASTSSNAATFDFGAFTMNWDETTIFGNPTVTPGAGTFQILWTNAQPAAVTLPFAALSLPVFSITANSGFQLSGPVSVFIGDLAYQDATDVTVVSLENATVNVDGLDTKPGSLAFDKSGQAFSLTQEIGAGPFNSFGLTGVVVMAASGTDATLLEPAHYGVSFSAAPAPVPVPGAAWLLTSGLVGLTLRRRRKAS